MSRKSVYGLLAVLGSVLPWIYFSRFFLEQGPAGDFVGALFVNGAAAGFSTDLLVSSLVFWLWLFAEARRLAIARPWLYVVVNLLVGLSCALPLFLYVRESRLASTTQLEQRAAA